MNVIAEPGASQHRLRENYLVAVLFFVNLVAYLDRQILSLLVDPIKQSLGLSDTMIGTLQGLAFVLTYSIGGLFLGRLVDRGHRRNLLLACIIVWSVSAASGAFVQSGWQLVLARAGVGLGEAALIPTAVSLLADTFKPERRGAALGIFSMGVHAGAGLALVLVGILLPFAMVITEVIGRAGLTVEPWRVVLFALLLPGILCIVLLVTVSEPARTMPVPPRGRIIDLRSWRQGAAVYVPHHLALALVTLNGFALGAWAPSILIRQYGLSASQAGLLYGSVAATIGVVGAYAGGRIGDWRSRVGGVRARLLLAMWAMPISVAGFLLMGIAMTVSSVMIGIAIGFFGVVVAIVIGLVSISDLAPPQSRGQVTAIYLFFTGVLGSALGPVIAGAANDRLKGLGISLAQIVATIGMVGSMLAFVLLGLACARLRSAQTPTSSLDHQR